MVISKSSWLPAAVRQLQGCLNRDSVFGPKKFHRILSAIQGIRGLTIQQLQEKDTWGGTLRQRVVILGSGKLQFFAK
jgi:hypothetical protein